MRAVRVECATPSIEHDPRVQEALRAVSWDYRGTLDQIDGRPVSYTHLTLPTIYSV